MTFTETFLCIWCCLEKPCWCHAYCVGFLLL